MAITGTEHPTSPQILKQQNGNRVVKRVYQYARADAWEAEMPALNSLDATDGYFRGYQTQNGPAYLIVTLTYDSDGTGVNFAPGDGDTEYWAETRGEEVPIEYHPDYLVNWNHALWGKNKGNGIATLVQFNALAASAWADMTDITDARGAGEDFKVSKGDPGLEWTRIEKKEKPGLEFYLRPQRVVVERAFHRQQADAEAGLAAVGALSTPAETFGESGGSWLVTTSNTKYDGKYWVTETEYAYSDKTNALGTIGWDTEIYATTTT
jgi:hypothetical protein